MIYISGKITGTDDYLERFNRAENMLSTYSAPIVNPAKVNSMMPMGTTYQQYMDMSMCMLRMCDAIYMLDGWRESNGAVLEHQYAKINNYMIFYENYEDKDMED